MNSDGPLVLDRPHEFKVLATYQIPKVELGVNAYYRYISGRTYDRRALELLVRLGGAASHPPTILESPMAPSSNQGSN